MNKQDTFIFDDNFVKIYVYLISLTFSSYYFVSDVCNGVMTPDRSYNFRNY